MPRPPAVIFDDAKGLLAPLTDLRPSFDIRTGALTTLDRLRRVHELQVAALWTPPSLAALTAERHRLPVNQLPKDQARVTLVNGRCAAPPPQLEALADGELLVEAGTGDLIAAVLPAPAAAAFLGAGSPPAGRTVEIPAPALLSRPWHVRTFRDRALAEDLEELCAGRSCEPPLGTLGLGEEPLCIHPSAVVYPGVTLDIEHGPICIDEHAVIRPGAILIGPCYVAPHATVLERATIRPNTAVGPWCKVNGEIGGTIFQGYANKAHDGYLGDSYVGEWVNLGAGTTTSNLLNTYAEVIARALPDGAPGSKHERTGETFLGAVIGDHVKTAICTRLMTGCVLHTGSMFATTAPVEGCVPAFTWATDDPATGRPVHKPYRLDKFLDVMRAAMARRKVEPSEAYAAAIARLHPSASSS